MEKKKSQWSYELASQRLGIPVSVKPYSCVKGFLAYVDYNYPERGIVLTDHAFKDGNNPNYLAFHEFAHLLLGHQASWSDKVHRSGQEVEAETCAKRCCEVTGIPSYSLNDYTVCKTSDEYIQSWRVVGGDDLQPISSERLATINAVADKIIAAGMPEWKRDTASQRQLLAIPTKRKPYADTTLPL